ncbi:MAG: hypothetical protein KKA32_09440 [Actinobacteria bacterium]|nr:hypothetical protein [Actinomycetota bacterium]
MHVSRARLLVAALAATLVVFASVGLGGCGLTGGKADDRSQNLMQLWSEFPGSADWDLEIRGVDAQKKSTGSHDAWYTVYKVTYTSKRVPAFAIYASIDIPKDDSMEFANRVEAFFVSTTGILDNLPPDSDKLAFMSWWAQANPDKYFLRMRADDVGSGSPTYTVLFADTIPDESAATVEFSEIAVAYDSATGEWSSD